MRKFAVAAILLFAPFLCSAADSAAPQQQQKGEEKELADLLSIVQQETDVATKTRMNSDYVPGIVSVLEGDDLEALGIAKDHSRPNCEHVFTVAQGPERGHPRRFSNRSSTVSVQASGGQANQCLRVGLIKDAWSVRLHAVDEGFDSVGLVGFPPRCLLSLRLRQERA